MERSSSPSLGLIDASVKRVIWDWNGTLIDDLDHCVAIMNGLLREAGLEAVDRRRHRELFDHPVRSYYERLGFELDDRAWEVIALRFIQAYDRGVFACTLQPGVPELLAELGRRGLKSSILSAARTPHLEEMLRHHGIRHLLGNVVGLDDHYAHGKEELGKEWMKRDAIDPHTTLLVGDTTHDFEVAQAMGIRCVLVTHGHHTQTKLEDCGCTVVPGLRALL